jgi:uncharacterized protein
MIQKTVFLKHFFVNNSILFFLFCSFLLVAQNNVEGAYLLKDGGKLIVSGQPSSDLIYLRETKTGEVRELKRIDNLNYESSNSIYDQMNPVKCFFKKQAGEIISLKLISKNGLIANASKIRLHEEYSYFKNDTISLFGKLVTPEGDGPFPIIVSAQGSNSSSAIKSSFFQYLLPSEGISTFIYDKRGTGLSGGAYTQLFDVLADDLVEGINSLEKNSKIDMNRVGLIGFSQGGWVAPLAALKSGKVKFMAIAYGLVITISEEDLFELPIKFKAMGFHNKDIQELKDFNEAVHFIFENNFKTGWNTYQAKIDKYKDREWFKVLKTTQTWSGVLLQMGMEDAKKNGPNLLKTFDPFYNPVNTLKDLNIPMLWLFGEEDVEAPPKLSIERLESLMKEYQKPFTLKTYPDADHGMYLFFVKDNKRIKTKHPSTYLNDITFWLRKQAFSDTD